MAAWKLIDSNCDTCDFEEDFSQEQECDGCDEAGLSYQSIVVCYKNIASLVQNPCTVGNEKTGMVTDVNLVSGAKVMAFTSFEDTASFTSTETYNVDNRSKTINETITGRGKIGNQELCWMRNFLGKQLVRFEIDNCGNVLAFGLQGGLRLTEHSSTSGVAKGDSFGIAYTFTNTTEDGYVLVDWASMGATSPEDWMLKFYNGQI